MIYKTDIKYRLLQKWVNFVFRFNFNKLIFTGKEHIPEGKPIIYAPTHRNALIDALLLVKQNVKQQVVFLARADIFKKPTIAKLLNFLGLMPVYRIRDGKDNLAKNQEIFESCGTVLKSGNPICIFPEGVHNPKQSLLPLRKAIPRIALPTEAQSQFQLDTHIVPIAFHYMDIDGFLSDLYVTYGEPIRVTDYKKMFGADENQAINQMRKDLDTRLRRYVVDIPVDENYNQYVAYLDYNAEKVAKNDFNGKKDGIVPAKQKLIAELNELQKKQPALFQDKMEQIGMAIQKITKFGLTTKDPINNPLSASKNILNFIVLLLTSTLALIGLFNSIIPILIYHKLIAMFKDKQFISSVRLLVGAFILPLVYLLQTLAVGLVFHSTTIAFIYLVASPMLFYFGSYWRKWWKKNVAYSKIISMQKKSAHDWEFVTRALKMNEL